MEISKEQIVKALEEVYYFPGRDNIISLKMVDELKIDGNKISFTLVFPKLPDNSSKIVREACEKAIKSKVDNKFKLDITEKTEADTGKGALSGIKNIIAVASGKGGVGKSTVAVNLAIALKNGGARVGLIDADIYGPSIPTMFDLEGSRPYGIEEDGKSLILPIEKYGIYLLSIGFFVSPEQALIWRGPMASNAIKQLLNDTKWDHLDYLVIDLPPGTGDIHLTLAQEYSIDGIVIVTTPQKVALADVQKAATMFRQEKIHIPILGMVENMSYFTPAELPDNKYFIFGKSQSEKFAKKLNIPFLGQIPVVQRIAESGDLGKPVSLNEESPEGKAFTELADIVKHGLKALKN